MTKKSVLEIQNTYTPIPTLTPINTKKPTQLFAPTPSYTESPTLEPSLESITTIPGAIKKSPIDGMVLVYIPAGAFKMGSLESDEKADYDEKPEHLVFINAFWMDQTVVTNAMFARFLNDIGNRFTNSHTWLDAGDEDVLIFQSDNEWRPIKGFENRPVVEVTWYGAQAYCQWAGRRLPREAEWERAARGDDGRIYPWGDDITCENAQYASCTGGLQAVDNKPAGTSPYGVLGLSGNTWEWTADWYAADYYLYSPIDNPKGPDDGETRTLRGGSWEYDWKHLRAANRRHNGPAVSMHDYSFRCVQDK